MMTSLLRELGSTTAKLRVALDEVQPDSVLLAQLKKSLEETLLLLFKRRNLKDICADKRLWRELLGLVASGKVVTLVARAEHHLSTLQETAPQCWVGSGRNYSQWLAQGAFHVVSLNLQPADEAYLSIAGAQLLSRSLSLGYPDSAVEGILNKASDVEDGLVVLSSLVSGLEVHQQRRMALALINCLANLLSGNSVRQTPDDQTFSATTPPISAAAIIIKTVLEQCGSDVRGQIISHFTRQPPSSIEIMRVVVASLSPEDQELLLTSLWQAFGNRLLIRQRPIVHSEATIKFLCVALAHVDRRNHMHVFLLARSSAHTTGVSEYLKSPSPRIRFFGVAVGVLVSELVDKPEQRMQYDFDGEEQRDVDTLRTLLRVQDQPGLALDALGWLRQQRQPNTEVRVLAPAEKYILPNSPSMRKSNTQSPKIVLVDESDDMSTKRDERREAESDSDDLKPLAKPLNDPEDSEDDASLVTREKPRVPIYLRDLVNGLEATGNHDLFRLSLVTAPGLIARKAVFGKELADVAEDLASLLAGLRDPFGFDDFDDMQRAALAALLIAAPQDTAKVCIRAFWHNDNSLAQRLVILQAIGAAANELGDPLASSPDSAPIAHTAIASTQLSKRLHNLYLESPKSPRAHKERLAASETVNAAHRGRTKRFNSGFAKILARTFFFPLLNGWLLVGTHDRWRRMSGLTSPFVQLLALLLRKGGRSSVLLGDMLREFWDFLLSIRASATEDAPLREAMLVGLLAIFELDDDPRSLARRRGKPLLETYEWTHAVFESTSEADEEGQRIKALAAAVLVKAKDIMETYQRLLIGDTITL